MSDIITIQSIMDMYPIMDRITSSGKKRVYVASDWDNCITMYDGCNLPLRDGEDTKNFFSMLNEIGIPWFVLTSRYHGIKREEIASSLVVQAEKASGRRFDVPNMDKLIEYTSNCLAKDVLDMISALPALDPSVNRLTGNIGSVDTLVIYDLPMYQKDELIILHRNVVFAGTRNPSEEARNSNKGIAFDLMIKRGMLPQPDSTDYFIFMDNDLPKIQDVIQAAELIGIRDKLIPIYYPQEPRAQGICQSTYDISACMSDHLQQHEIRN
jgi:hypothetical protein